MEEKYVKFFLDSKKSIIEFETIEIYHPAFDREFFVVRNSACGLTANIEPREILFRASRNLFDTNSESIEIGKTVNNLTGELQGNSLFNVSGFIEVQASTNYYVSNISRFVYYDSNFDYISGESGVPRDVLMQSPSTAAFIKLAFVNHLQSSQIFAQSDVAVDFEPFGEIEIEGQDHTTERHFEYVPMQVKPTAAKNDLDFGVDVVFGDLGELLSKQIKLVRASNQSTIKPSLIYRGYRSDDLTSPMNGPFVLEIQNISFNRQGSAFKAVAPTVNLSRTGEVYTTQRFKGLKGL